MSCRRAARTAYVVLGFLLLAASGCGEKAPVLTEVEGTVRLNNKPAEGIYVEFAPDPAKGTKGPVSTGTTDAAGRFVLKTNKNEAGAVVGWHRIALSDLKASQASQDQLAAGKRGYSRIPDKYATASGSDLVREVKEGKNVIPLEIPGR